MQKLRHLQFYVWFPMPLMWHVVLNLQSGWHQLKAPPYCMCPIQNFSSIPYISMQSLLCQRILFLVVKSRFYVFGLVALHVPGLFCSWWRCRHGRKKKMLFSSKIIFVKIYQYSRTSTIWATRTWHWQWGLTSLSPCVCVCVRACLSPLYFNVCFMEIVV